MSTHQIGNSERQWRPTIDWTPEQSWDGSTGDFSDELRDSFPGNKQVWELSPLGMPETWSEALRAYSRTIKSLAYPACIFWGEEMVILQNREWTTTSSIRGQGQKQRGRLSADAFNALSTSLHSGAPQSIDSRGLLPESSAAKAANFNVLISPLYSSGTPRKVGADGSLVQLLPKPDLYDRAKEGKWSSPSDACKPEIPGKESESKFCLSQLGQTIDNSSFDAHPFFHRFADMLPTGIAILDQKAQAVFVNQNFYQLTTHRGENQEFKSWPQSIHPDDYKRVMEAYSDAFLSQKQLRTEFRALGAQNPWRLLLLTPLGDDNLQHVSLRDYGGFICNIVDITSEKSAELAERNAAKDARERKEQLERFIDMVSHEIRNPLSAMLHCSEDIDGAVSDPKNVDFTSIKDAVETINVCIQHQRNIVDDVLSFSKLDASMLTLSPKASLPDRQLADSLKLFQPEFRRQDMQFGYKIDQSYIDSGVSWVMADMARIGQVLINLVSNAIKFTAKAQGDKKVVVSVGASVQRPSSYPPNVVFFKSENHTDGVDATNTQDWGRGEAVHIMVAVQDTGIGISDEVQQRLFERFTATPKTVEIYGGSGLGLNISRKLCNIHGGEVGVSSKAGSGSTFGFFFKVKRCEKPQDYEGRAEEQEVAGAAMEYQIKLTSPEARDECLVRETSMDPPLEDTGDIVALSHDQQDDRYQRTAGIASKVQQEWGFREKSKGCIPTSGGCEGNQRPIADLTSLSLTEEHDDHPNQAKSSGVLAASRSMPGHILLVEDNLINQKIVFRKLERKGFKVTAANNGKEAVEFVQSAPKPSTGDKRAFDICLMDMEMPIMDGNTATKTIRGLEKEGTIEHLPILGITANVRSEQKIEMRSAGMDDVISKPYRIEDMVKKMQQVYRMA